MKASVISPALFSSFYSSHSFSPSLPLFSFFPLLMSLYLPLPSHRLFSHSVHLNIDLLGGNTFSLIFLALSWTYCVQRGINTLSDVFLSALQQENNRSNENHPEGLLLLTKCCRCLGSASIRCHCVYLCNVTSMLKKLHSLYLVLFICCCQAAVRGQSLIYYLRLVLWLLTITYKH